MPNRAPATPQILASSAQVRMLQRIAHVRDLLAKAIPVRTIIKTLSAEWGLGEAMLREYIKRAYIAAQVDAAQELPQRRAQLRETMEETYQLAIDSGDLKAATMLLDRMAKLDGAYLETRVTVSGGVEVAIGPGNPEATRDRIKELLANPEIQAQLAGGVGSGHATPPKPDPESED